MPGYQLPSGAHGLVMRALDAEEGHMPEKKEMSIADLLRRERAQKRAVQEKEALRVRAAQREAEEARQLALRREEEARVREEERQKQLEIERQEALVREVEENERKTKTYFDVDQYDKHKPTFHHLVKQPTGGQYFGDYEYEGKDPQQLEDDAKQLFLVEKCDLGATLNSLSDEQRAEMTLFVKKRVGKERQMLKALRPFVDWHAHGRGEFRANDGNTVYEGDYVRGRRHGRGTWFFDDGSSWEGTFSRDDAKGLGTYRWTEEVKEKDEDGAYVVVDRKIHERDAIYHDNRRAAFVDELKKGCRLRLPSFRLSSIGEHATVVGRPTKSLERALEEAERRCLRSREGERFATNEEWEGYRDAAEALRKEARAALWAATKYHLHFDLSNTEREVDLADVPFVLDDHKPLIHHFARDEHLDLKRYDVTDAERRARPPSPPPTQALATFRDRGRTLSRPVSRESTATNLQLQLSPSKAKQSTTLTLRNSHRRHHLLKALTLDEGSQSDHHENFYEFKVKKKAPPKKITMDPAARKAYLQKQADKQRAIIEAQRQAQLGEALEGQAQLDAASAREEADFEAQMEARIIVLKEERERRMAEVRAGTVTEVQEAFLEGPWRDSAEQQRLSRTYERDTEMSRAERRMRGKFRPGAHSYEDATTPMPVRAPVSQRQAPLHYTKRIAIRRDDDTWLHDYEINRRAADARRAVQRVWDAERRAWEAAEKRRRDQEHYVKHCLSRVDVYKRELAEAEAARKAQDAEDERSAEEDRPGSAWSQSSEISEDGARTSRWSLGSRSSRSPSPKKASRKESAAHWRQRRTHEPDAKPGSRSDLCKIVARRGHVPKESTEMSLEAGAAVVVLKSELSDAPGWIFATRGNDECGYVPRTYLLRDRSRSPSRRSWFGSRGSARGRSPKPKPKKKKGGGGFFSWLSKKEHEVEAAAATAAHKIEHQIERGVAAVTPIKKKKKKAPMTYGEMKKLEKERARRKAERRRGKGRLRKIPGFDHTSKVPGFDH